MTPPPTTSEMSTNLTPEQVNMLTSTPQMVIQSAPDPVTQLVPVIEIFLPLGPSETNTMLGLWFDAVGFLHVYVQQAAIPDNIYGQVKIITIRVPPVVGFAIFNLGLAHFFARSFILALRASRAQTANEIKKMLEKVIQNIK